MRRGKALHVPFLFLMMWVCFFVHSCRGVGTGHPRPDLRGLSKPPTIQIGISPHIQVERGSFAVRGPCRIGAIAYEEGFEGEAVATPTGIRIGEVDYTTPVVRVEVENDTDLELNKIRYHGDLLVCKANKGLSLVNEVDLEDYLAGVVGKEMHLKEHREALKAQVIAARTYAVGRMRSGWLRKIKGEVFDLYDDQRSQVYGGTERENGLARELVDETRGMFLMWEGEPVETFYSSTCGGATDAAWKVLEEGAQIEPLAGRTCGYCESSPRYRWEKKIAVKEIVEKLFPNELHVKVREIRTLEPQPGGHVLKIGIALEGQAKERVFSAYREFRRKLGLDSTLIDSIERNGNEFIIKGRGWGHGAGMCQYGAYALARQGRTAIEVMEYYYPGAKVQKMY